MQLKSKIEIKDSSLKNKIEIRSKLKKLLKSEQFKKESSECEEIDLPQQKHRNMLTLFLGKIKGFEFL